MTNTLINKNIPGKEFRLQGKKLLLTYSQCPLDLDFCINVIKDNLSLKNGRTVTEFMLSIEKHKDQQSTHIHAYIELNKRIDSKNPRLFDITLGDKTYHPNILVSRYKNACLEYILKDVIDLNSLDFIASPELRRYLSVENNKIKILTYHQAVIKLSENGAVDEAMNLIKHKEPAKYISSHISLRKSLKALQSMKNQLSPKVYVDCTHMTVVQDVKEEIKKAHSEYLTPMLVGETKTGKTVLMHDFIVNTLKLSPLIINNIDGIRFFDPNEHNTLFFDDCNFSTVQTEEMLLKLFDCESATTFNVKHGSVQIPANTPRFVCSNVLLSHYVGSEIASMKKIARRLKIINIGNQQLYQFLPAIYEETSP